MDRTKILNEINSACAKMPKCNSDCSPLCRECGKIIKIRKTFGNCTDEEFLRLSKTLNTPGENDSRVKALSDFCDNRELCSDCPIKCNELMPASASDCSFDEMDEALIDDLYESLMSLEKPKPDPEADVNKENDAVNNPEHYTFGGIETVDYLRAKLTKEEFIGWCRGNALKYLSRVGHKDEELQEYRKTAKYIEWIIDAMKE